MFYMLLIILFQSLFKIVRIDIQVIYGGTAVVNKRCGKNVQVIYLEKQSENHQNMRKAVGDSLHRLKENTGPSVAGKIFQIKNGVQEASYLLQIDNKTFPPAF